jgi:hypothetical protein
VTLFVVAYGIIFSMYGGGFATVPTYLRDCSARAMSALFTACC